MKFSAAVLTAAALASTEGLFARAEHNGRDIYGSGGKGGSSSRGGRKSRSGSRMMLRLKVTNLTYDQIFSPFFAMVHDEHVTPLYTLGAPAHGNGLYKLAEDGDSSDLTGFYGGETGAKVLEGTAAVLMPGKSAMIDVAVDKDFPLVTIASMAVSTNDCFVAVNGAALAPGDVNFYPGLDAGTEDNNEDCAFIPGPPCGNPGVRDTDGAEDFVHIHRGIHGVANLVASEKDWRNPMMRVEVMEYMY